MAQATVSTRPSETDRRMQQNAKMGQFLEQLARACSLAVCAQLLLLLADKLFAVL